MDRVTKKSLAEKKQMKRLPMWLFIPPIIIGIVAFNFVYVELNTSGEIIGIIDSYLFDFGSANGLGIDGMYIFKHSLFGFTPAILFLLTVSFGLYIYKFSLRNNVSTLNDVSVRQIIYYALFSISIAVLLSPHIIPIEYFENPFYFLVTGTAFSMTLVTFWINITNNRDKFELIIKIFFLALVLGGALSIEIANFFYMSHHEGTNIHRDINGGVIVPFNLTSHIYLPGYFLWRGLTYYIIFTSFLLLMELFWVHKNRPA